MVLRARPPWLPHCRTAVQSPTATATTATPDLIALRLCRGFQQLAGGLVSRQEKLVLSALLQRVPATSAADTGHQLLPPSGLQRGIQQLEGSLDPAEENLVLPA